MHKTILSFILLAFTINASSWASDAPATNKPEPKETKNSDHETQEKPKLVDNKELKQGDLMIDLSKTKELIAKDKALLEVAERNYNDSMTSNDNPLERQKLARQYKREIRELKQRIATHEGMVKKWDQQLVQTTGKTKDS